MARIRTKLRISTVSGKSGTVFYQVAHKKEVKQITTRIHLLPEEWNAEEERISSVALSANPRLSGIQQKIESNLALLERIVRNLEISGADFGVQQIVDRFASTQTTIYVLDYIDKEITSLTAKGKHSTARNYRSCRNSLAEFLQDRDMTFDELTETVVTDYEAWLKGKGLKRNASSSYLRTLQSIYNKVSKQGLIQSSGNPFREVYTGVDKTRKRAVEERVVARLKAMDLTDAPSLAKARDLFLFSYCTRGMSFVDMAYLTRKQLVNGTIQYKRRKTGQPLSVRIEPYVQAIIERYQETVHNGYILPIIHSDDEKTAYRQYQTALRYYNKKLKELSVLLGDGISLTSYTARHSWATTAHRHNTPLTVISDCLGHHSERTTQIYLDSINEDVIDHTNADIVASLDKLSKGL